MVNVTKKFVAPVNKKEAFMHALNIYLADAIAAGLSAKAYRVITSVKYLQRKGEEVYPGEVHAMYYEITRDPTWTYESCREACNQLAKRGWLEKYRFGNIVAYTLSEKAKELVPDN